MPRPESASATVIDTGGLPPETEANNGPKDTTDSETNNPVDVETNNPDPNGGAEAGETEGDANQEGSETEGAEGGAEPTEVDSKETLIAQMREELIPQLKESLREEIMAEMRQPQQDPEAQYRVPELSEEQWAGQEAAWGVARNTIQRITQQAMTLHKDIMSKIDQRLAKFEKADSLRSLSQDKAYSDALRYQKDVDEFLQSYDPRSWSNPALLKRAVEWSRGRHLKATVNQVRKDTERNRKISGVARPSAGAGVAKKPGAATRTLTALERDVAARFGMTEKEYLDQKNGSKVIAR